MMYRLSRTYTDSDGNLYYIHFGVGKRAFMCKGFCLRRNPKNGQKRESGISELPYRYEFDQAQADLDAWAAKQGLTQIRKLA